MDIVYTYRHARDDFELRYSLRSVERHAAFVRKVWIYGDRPDFLSADTTVVEHVPHELNAAVLGVKTPIRSFFLMLYLSSLIPELTSEYLWFSDDFFLLRDYSVEDARVVRYLEDLKRTPRPARPGQDPWKDQVWRTYDNLRWRGYGVYNFETHTPTHLTKRRVADAYGAFRDLITEGPTDGITAATAILNHAHKHEGFGVRLMRKERAGYWGRPPQSYGHVIRDTCGSTFLNFDDAALCDPLRRFLHERFPNRSRFERDEAAEIARAA